MSQTKKLVESAILIAIAIVLELLSKVFPFQLPFGGGITLVSMLPIVIIGYKYGIKWGFLIGIVYSIIEMMLGFQTISMYFIGEEVMPFGSAILITFIDYTVAFTVIGLSGIFKDKLKTRNLEIILGSIVAISLRFLAHFVSGFLFWGAYAEWFFTQDGMGKFGEGVMTSISGTTLSLFYSFIYNGSYMIPEIILTTIALSIIINMPQLRKNIIT